ncbi:MAG: MerR family transcriptional regulator [Candidatus Eisenbacteria bacterium]
MDRCLKVGELARESGKSVRAIHLYEQMGLISALGRTKGHYRIFAESTLERLEWITHLQAFGLSLTQIQELIGSIGEVRVGREAMARMREMYAEKRDQIGKTIRTLQSLEKELDRSLLYLEVCRECDAPKPKEACVDCARERPVEKPSLVRGLHADIGWVDLSQRAALSTPGAEGTAPASGGSTPTDHSEFRSP